MARLLALNSRPQLVSPPFPACLGRGGEPCCPSPFQVGVKGTPQARFSLSSLMKVSLSKAGGLHAE